MCHSIGDQNTALYFYSVLAVKEHLAYLQGSPSPGHTVMPHLEGIPAELGDFHAVMLLNLAFSLGAWQFGCRSVM